MAKKFIAVFHSESKKTDIFPYVSLDDLRKNVLSKNCRFKTFDTEEEAKKWLDEGAKYKNRLKTKVTIVKSEMENHLKMLNEMIDYLTDIRESLLNDEKSNKLVKSLSSKISKLVNKKIIVEKKIAKITDRINKN